MFKLGLLWVGTGIFLSAPFWVRTLQASHPTTTTAPVDTSHVVNADKPRIAGNPVRIQFPALGIDKQIIPGYYDEKTGAWTLSDTNAQYATVTPEPNNQTGNTFIYGHNNMRTFGGLLSANVGLEAVVTTDNQHTFRYVLREIADVKPDDPSYLAQHNSPILTVQTCSGFWSENRRMFVFDLVEAS